MYTEYFRTHVRRRAPCRVQLHAGVDDKCGAVLGDRTALSHRLFLQAAFCLPSSSSSARASCLAKAFWEDTPLSSPTAGRRCSRCICGEMAIVARVGPGRPSYPPSPSKGEKVCATDMLADLMNGGSTTHHAAHSSVCIVLCGTWMELGILRYAAWINRSQSQFPTWASEWEHRSPGRRFTRDSWGKGDGEGWKVLFL